MAEISREECISRLNTMRNQMSVCLATDFAFGNNFSIMKSMCDKAISDMEKLKKIEKILFKDEFDFTNRPFVSIGMLNEIEQIIKGVER